MKQLTAGAFVAVAICVAASLQSNADDVTAATQSTSPVPSATMSVGSLQVERFGTGNPAVILIPGLDCGSWVWNGSISELSAKHTVYAVTLAGFDGTKAAGSQLIDSADASIEKLILQERLVKPILVGHSLGGFLAIRFAEEHSDEIGGVVAVDGTPVFPTLAQMTASDRIAAADSYAAQLRSVTPEAFAASQKTVLASMITDPTTAAQVAVLAAKSDPAASAEYVDEMLRADLRSNLNHIGVPLLELAPVPVPKDLPAGFPDSMRAMTPDQLAATWVQFDAALFPGATTLKIVPIGNSRHFAMLDQPAAFEKALDAFVDSSK